MSVDSVKKHLKKYNMADRIITVKDSSATVALAAKALGCSEDEIAKTLSFQLKDRCILIVVSGESKIDNSKYKKTFKEKAHMLPFAEVNEKIGHPVGGVCPFGVNEGVDIYLDESLKKYEFVYPACGSANNAIKIAIPELEEVTNYTSWVDVVKEKTNE